MPVALRSSVRPALLAVLAFVTIAFASPLAAQQPPAATATVVGRVVDAVSGAGVPRAQVRLPALGRMVLTSEEGYFLIDGVPEGEHEWAFRRLGYADWDQVSPVKDGDRLTVRMLPRPAVLEGITVTANAFEVNRRRVAMRVDAVDEETIMASGLTNAVDILSSRANVAVAACPPSNERACVWVHNDLIRPAVWIDDEPAPGGLTQLLIYPAAELYTIEAFGGGRAIRVYTRRYVERLAELGRRPDAFMPLWGGGGGSVRPGGAFAPVGKN
ncbi:MAG TPA: carboxypeptidase regulatory-like domain-containing protein [Longimicrobiaceae bacterium]|nr:carboxypeptidase regulatory-like domain-containing protein [Longimicrobiaceae bacterium]